MNILIVVGTRPNFIKITQFKNAAKLYPDIDIKIAHTGQHFDKEMADVFFQQLDIYPDYFLNASNQGVIYQFADIMLKLDELMSNVYQPDLLIVPGDVNSTLISSLVANKKGIKIAHLESGLRSWDREMPEEINRVLTDVISDYYFITEHSGLRNLENKEMVGVKYFVGNTMIDTLVAFKKQINDSTILNDLSLRENEYVLVTLHRPSNVDKKSDLGEMVKILNLLANQSKVVFPIHPRTKKKLEQYGLNEKVFNNKQLIETGPLDYFSFQKLIMESKYVVTDSGGIQEETTYYGVPCLTLRMNTERPSTIEVGTNELVSFDLDELQQKVLLFEQGKFKSGAIPELWDGKATERILKILSELQ